MAMRRDRYGLRFQDDRASFRAPRTAAVAPRPSPAQRLIRFVFWLNLPFALFLAGAVIVAIVTASAAPKRPSVIEQLAKIPSAAGGSVLDRLQRCGITINRRDSWIEPAYLDTPQISAKAGDLILEIFITPPPWPGADPEERRLLTDLVARWVISSGVATPNSGWAKALQNEPPPLNWMHC